VPGSIGRQDMLPGPIFRREMKAGGRKLFRVRTVLALMIACFVVPPALLLLFGSDFVLEDTGISRATAARIYAAYAVAATIGAETWFLALLAAGAVSISIAEEREKDTLPLLLLTRLTRLELAATKLVGRLMPIFLAILTGLPLIVVGAWIADLPALLVVEALAVTASTAAVAGSLGILASSRQDRSAAASGEAVFWTMLWLGLPMASLLPARSGTLWGDLLVELRRVAGWLAPSSPVSLLTNWSWFANAADAPDMLANRFLTMLAMQAAVIVLALAGSIAGLRLREPHPTSLDPHRGYRPPVGDDPIYWREYLLPWRGGRVPIVFVLMVRLLIALRTLLVLALGAALLAIAVAIPIALVLASGWFGYHAFREYWGFDPSPAGTSLAGDQFNWFIRAVTFMLGLSPMMSAGTAAAARITLERDKKTWESLLTTPLTGPEILSSKMRVDAQTIWKFGSWLIPLWLLGIACGALHPLGAVLAFAGLVVGTWLSLVLGIRTALRPGATTQSINSTSGLWFLALMFVGALTIVAPLCSGRDLEVLRSVSPRLPWVAAVAMVAVAVAMAAWARSLTRRCFERFDEWVDRPHRSSPAEPRRDHSPAADLEAVKPGAVGSPPHRSGPSLVASPPR
jgi:ABC-type transport system involved in multi-copper enzyme maturation permease subunit